MLLAVENGLSRAANLLLKRGVDGAEKCNKEKNSLLHVRLLFPPPNTILSLSYALTLRTIYISGSSKEWQPQAYC